MPTDIDEIRDASAFWTDALDPKNGAKIIAVYPSGSTIDFTQTARKTTEGRDRLVEWYANLKAAVKYASIDMHRPSDRPCPTCLAVSKALHEPWGCYAYHVRIGRPPVPDFTKF